MHNIYLFFLTKHVVPWKGFESSGSIVIDTRTMDEFIASLVASKVAFLFQPLHNHKEAPAPPCRQTPNELG